MIDCRLSLIVATKTVSARVRPVVSVTVRCAIILGNLFNAIGTAYFDLAEWLLTDGTDAR